MQCLKVLLLSPIYPSSLLHKRMSSTMTTTCPHAQVPPICPRCHSLLQANCVTTIHSHKLLFLLLPGLLSHTPSSTLSIVVTLSRPCPASFPRQETNTQTKTRADKCYSTGDKATPQVTSPHHHEISSSCISSTIHRVILLHSTLHQTNSD